jgi:hypothetical protein
MERSALVLFFLSNLLAAKPTVAMLDAETRMEAARHQLLDRLAPFQDDRPGDLVALETSYANYAQTISIARAITVGPESGDLRRAFSILLASEDEAKKDLGSVVDKIRASHGRLDLLVRLNVSGSLNRSESSEAAALRRFRAAVSALQ